MRVVKNPRQSDRGVGEAEIVLRNVSGWDDEAVAGGPGVELAGRIWERVLSLASC